MAVHPQRKQLGFGTRMQWYEDGKHICVYEWGGPYGVLKGIYTVQEMSELLNITEAECRNKLQES